MSIKVLFYSHQSNLAGAPLSLAALASNLPKPYEAYFVTPETGPVLSKVTCKKLVIGKWFQERKLEDLIKKLDIDIVHANTLFAWPAVAAANATHVPVIWHIREDLDLFPKSLTSKVEKHADQIIVIANWMKKFFKNSNKTHVIHNGIQIQNATAPLSSTPLFVTLGTIEPRKGIHTLIDAAIELKKRNQKFKIQIYGKPLPTTQGYFRKLRSKIKKENLESFVEFKGVTPNIAKVLAPAWAVIVPSLSEPFGRVAVEAMALKKPVIASNTGGLSEIVAHGKTGLLFKPKNSKALSQILLKMIPNKNPGKKMGQAGYKRYRKLFSLEKHIQETVQIYQNSI